MFMKNPLVQEKMLYNGKNNEEISQSTKVNVQFEELYERRFESVEKHK